MIFRRSDNASSRPSAGRTVAPALWRVYGAGAAVCAAMTVAAYIFGVAPALAAHDADAADTAEIQSRHDKSIELAERLAATRHQLEQARREVGDLRLRLEPAAHMSRLAWPDLRIWPAPPGWP